jgi:radical SAM superfamily enzyme YgiQ (UPF0313 family)
MHASSIVLATANARYIHPAFGLRWIWSNLGLLRENAVIREFKPDYPTLEIVEDLLCLDPSVIGFGVYIWNIEPLTKVVRALKLVRPDIVVVIGGPEVSREYEDASIYRSADYLVQGEGEIAFRRLVEEIIAGRAPERKVIEAEPPPLDELVPPYAAYSDHDLAQRLTYVEASRGCPFGCEFCLSSLEPRVREFPLAPFLEEMSRLIERGAQRFKFVDRTFNLSADRVETVLDFFQARWREEMTLHFEIVPDRLSERMLRRIAEFPPGGLHLEVGVQSTNQESLRAIGRRQDVEKALENIRVLREETGALIHADLVAGLPCETWESFASAFDSLVLLRPHELQVGVLKRLKGAPIARHPIVFCEHPPYEALATEDLNFGQMQRLKRFARYFDLYYNSGNFPLSMPLLWKTRPSAFDAFMDLSDSLWAADKKTYQFSLIRLVMHMRDILVRAGVDSREVIAAALENDFHRVAGRKEHLDLFKS